MTVYVVVPRVMGVGSDIRKLGHFLEECEGGGGTIQNVEFVECVDSATGPTADIELAVSTSRSDQRQEEFAPTAVEIDANGRLRLAFESTTPIVPTTDPDLDITPTDATINADGTITVTLRASVHDGIESTDKRETEESERSSDPVAVSDEIDITTAADHDRNVPPFRDPELLETVYESCETFAEMSEAIEMDVTAETVRRYMIDYGIHEPQSYNTDGAENDDPVTDSHSDADGESPVPDADDGRTDASSRSERDRDRSSPVVLTDGIGLPDDVTLEMLVETVSRSNTVYEVKQDLGLDRDEAFELLRKLDLIDLVIGRVSNEHEREISREGIVDRLRECSVTES